MPLRSAPHPPNVLDRFNQMNLEPPAKPKAYPNRTRQVCDE